MNTYFVINTTTGTVVGHYVHLDQAQANLTAEKASRAIFINTPASLDGMTLKELVRVYNGLAEKPIKKFKTLEQARERVYKLLEVIPATDEIEPSKETDVKEEKKPRRKGAKQALRELFTSNPQRHFTREELEGALHVAWSNISTYISDLKNPKYAGGEVMVIEHDKEQNTYYLHSES